MMPSMYILSSACISPQNSLSGLSALNDPVYPETQLYYCQEPDFSQYINPVQIRRMSRALKIGYSAAIEAIQRAGPATIEAILIGTGKGCMADTELFLHSIREYHETALNATHFIHSTYNQLNGMIALNKKISCYNLTYVHRGFSFEHTLLDAALHFGEGLTASVLVGCFDEMTPDHFKVKKQWGYWKDEVITGKELLRSGSIGTFAGEGAAFFVLSNARPDGSVVSIEDVLCLYHPGIGQVEQEIDHLLRQHQLTRSDIDVLISGENGNVNYRNDYEKIESLFPNAQVTYFKHFCGEYDTAINFGLWAGCEILKEQYIPFTMMRQIQPAEKRPLQYALIYNNYFGKNQNIILLKYHTDKV